MAFKLQLKSFINPNSQPTWIRINIFFYLSLLQWFISHSYTPPHSAESNGTHLWSVIRAWPSLHRHPVLHTLMTSTLIGVHFSPGYLLHLRSQIFPQLIHRSFCPEHAVKISEYLDVVRTAKTFLYSNYFPYPALISTKRILRRRSKQSIAVLRYAFCDVFLFQLGWISIWLLAKLKCKWTNLINRFGYLYQCVIGR